MGCGNGTLRVVPEKEMFLMASDTQRLFDKLDELRTELVGVRLESRETKVKVAALELGVTESQHALTQRMIDVEKKLQETEHRAWVESLVKYGITALTGGGLALVARAIL